MGSAVTLPRLDAQEEASNAATGPPGLALESAFPAAREEGSHRLWMDGETPLRGVKVEKTQAAHSLQASPKHPGAGS